MSKKYIGVNIHDVEGRKGHYVYYQNSSPSGETKRLHVLLEVVDRRIDVPPSVFRGVHGLKLSALFFSFFLFSYTLHNLSGSVFFLIVFTHHKW